MSDLPTVTQLTTWALGIRAEDGAAEGITADDLLGGQELSDDELAQVWLSQQYYARAAQAAAKALGEELASRIEARGTGLEVNGEWIMYQSRKTNRIVDAKGFWEWMRQHPEYLDKAFNPNATRKTGMPPAIFDTFFETVETGSPVLSSVPVEILEAKKRGAKHDQT